MVAAVVGLPVTRDSLENALTFDLRLIPSELPKLTKTIVHHYGDKISGLQYLTHLRAVQIGFHEEVEISNIIEDGFSIDGQLTPKYHTYQSYSGIARIALSQLPCLREQKESALTDEALAECDKVVDLRFFCDPHAGVHTTCGCLHLDWTVEDGQTLKEIPNTVRVGSANVIFSWRNAPTFCVYCREPGHYKSKCEKNLPATSVGPRCTSV
jgi:hypothetical protein